jgi:hypothetical protein
MPLYETPGFVSNLRDARYWSLDWCTENNIEGPFNYVILLKQEGGYKVLGQFATATEAFDARRQLVADTGCRSYFLRAVRVVPSQDTVVVGPGHPESRESLDLYRDALATGNESLIPADQLTDFRQWASTTISNRPQYQRVDRDIPRVQPQHGEIPF